MLEEHKWTPFSAQSTQPPMSRVRYSEAHAVTATPHKMSQIMSICKLLSLNSFCHFWLFSALMHAHSCNYASRLLQMSRVPLSSNAQPLIVSRPCAGIKRILLYTKGQRQRQLYGFCHVSISNHRPVALRFRFQSKGIIVVLIAKANIHECHG